MAYNEVYGCTSAQGFHVINNVVSVNMPLRIIHDNSDCPQGAELSERSIMG